MNFQNLLLCTREKIEKYSDVASRIESNPELILTDLFSDGSAEFLSSIIDFSLEIAGEEMDVLTFQGYIYGLLGTHLRRTFKDVDFLYEEQKFPSLLYFQYEDEQLGTLDIYNTTFTLTEHSKLAKQSIKVSNMEDYHKSLENGISEYEGYEQNILSYGNTPLRKGYISLRKKHFSKLIRDKYKDFVEASMESEHQLTRERMQLERLKEDAKAFIKLQTTAISYFEKYGYRVDGEMLLKDQY